MGVPRAKVEVFQDRKKSWRWRFRVNGRVMADSGEGYTRRRAAWRAWDHFTEHVTGQQQDGAIRPVKTRYQELTRKSDGTLEIGRGL